MKKLLIGLALIGLISGCQQSKAVDTEKVKASLSKAIPELPKDIKVDKSPLNDVYQVTVGRKIFYVSQDGKYLVFGNIIDTATKQNLTEQAITQLSKIDFNQLPLDLAIKVVNGTGERKLAIFSDPDCPYCQLFEQKIAPNLKDTTIYTFLFPLPNHPNAKGDAKKIWCSKDRAKTWTAWMRDRKALPADDKCDTSDLDKVYRIATEVVQLEVTPTLILSNGQILAGALPADQLLALMDQARGKKVETNNPASASK